MEIHPPTQSYPKFTRPNFVIQFNLEGPALINWKIATWDQQHAMAKYMRTIPNQLHVI